MSELLKGIAASDGVAISKAYLLVEPDLSFSSENISDVDGEVEKFKAAVNQSKLN